MRIELQKQLKDKYPLLFCNLLNKDITPQTSCMFFGIECGDGWFDIINELGEKIEPIIRSMIANKECCEYGDGTAVPPCAEQVKEKFGCYDDKTEVLTEAGWKSFKDVVLEDKIAVLKDGKFLEYENPTDIIRYQYSGPMYKLKTRGVSLMVTPNHNLYIAKGSYYNGNGHKFSKRIDYNFGFATPSVFFGKNKRFLKSALWNGNSDSIFLLPETKRKRRSGRGPNKTRTYVKAEKAIDMKAWLAFLGFYVAEGCSSITKGVSISCNNTDGGEEKEYVENLIKSIGFNYKITQENKPACVFCIYDSALAEWLLRECGHKSQNKKVPSFVKKQSSENIKIFLENLYAGDGCQAKTSRQLTTVSVRLVDDVQELLLKAGYSSSVHQARKPKKSTTRNIKGRFLAYAVNWLKNSNDHNTQNKGLSKKAEELWVDYSGDVHCVTVSSGIIYVRRDFIPVWCGNSLRFYTNYGNDAIFEEISRAEEKSCHTCEGCGKTGVNADCSGGWVSTVCEECRDKYRNN